MRTSFRMKGSSSARGWFLFLFVVGGCASYHPMPITPEAIQARLRPPGKDELRVLASEIRHPILRPVNLKPEEGLSPDGAAVLAVLLNPSLRALRDKRGVARAQLLDARLLPDPELSYSLEAPTGGDTAGKVNAFGLDLSWEATALVSRAVRVDGAQAAKKAVELDIAWGEWQVAQAARSAVYQLVSLQSRIVLAKRISRQAARNSASIQRAVDEGVLTADALSVARAAERRAGEELVDLEKQSDRQRLQLDRILGFPDDSRIHLRDDIRLPSRIELPTPATLLEGLEQRRLDLVALRRGYESQEATLRTAVLEQFPKISLGPTLGRDTDGVRTTGFALNVELPIFNRHRGKVAMERATRRRLFDEYAGRVFEARSDIGLILSGMRFLNEQIAAAKASESELEALVESYGAALKEGRADALSYYGAWSDLTGARMKVLALRGELAQAVAALELASGFYEIPNAGPPEGRLGKEENR